MWYVPGKNNHQETCGALDYRRVIIWFEFTKSCLWWLELLPSSDIESVNGDKQQRCKLVQNVKNVQITPFAGFISYLYNRSTISLQFSALQGEAILFTFLVFPNEEQKSLANDVMYTSVTHSHPAHGVTDTDHRVEKSSAHNSILWPSNVGHKADHRLTEKSAVNPFHAPFLVKQLMMLLQSGSPLGSPQQYFRFQADMACCVSEWSTCLSRHCKHITTVLA